MRLPFWLLPCVLIAAWSPAAGQESPQDAPQAGGETPRISRIAPNLADMAQRGAFNVTKLEIGHATWSAVFRHEDTVRGAEVTVSGGMRRYQLFTKKDETREPYALVIMRDGKWYVSALGRNVQCLPYQYLFPDPSWYETIERAWPHAVNAAQPPGRFIQTQDGIAFYQAPLTVEVQRQLQKIIEKIEAIEKVDPDRARAEGYYRRKQEIQNMLASGVPVRADPETGFLLDYGDPNNRARLEGFQWLRGPDQASFQVSATQWADETDDLAPHDPHDLAMFAHAGDWSAEKPHIKPTAVVVNVKTRRMRRAPVPNAYSTPLGFTQNRKAVIVAAYTPDGLFPFEAHLTTGKVRRLGENIMDRGYMTSAEVSPDQQKVAVTFQGALGSTISRVLLIDLESGHASQIGSPGSIVMISWMPDSNGLIAMDVRRSNSGRVINSDLVQLKLDGESLKLRTGSLPVVLSDLRKILYADTQGGQAAWYLCDLDGFNEYLVADTGLPGLGSPVPGPDGRSVIMMKQDEQAKTIVPVVVSLPSGEVFELKLGGGLWTNPAWK